MATRNDLVDAIAKAGKIGEAEAAKVFDYYTSKAIKAIRFANAHDGYVVTHGAFLDAFVIGQAVTRCGWEA